jgi:hypothetical protein
VTISILLKSLMDMCHVQGKKIKTITIPISWHESFNDEVKEYFKVQSKEVIVEKIDVELFYDMKILVGSSNRLEVEFEV